MQYRELRSDRGSWLVNEFCLKIAFFNIHDTFKAGDWSSYVFLKFVYLTNHDNFFFCVKRKCGQTRTERPVSSEHVERTERWDLLTKPTKNPKPNKNADPDLEREDPLYSEIPEWLQESSGW